MNDSTPIRKKDVKERSIGDECMLYDVLAREVHVLNDTALFVWRFCDGNHTVNDIVDEAVNAYDITQEEAYVDIVACIEEFNKLSLLQI